ncbi:uncharacterized protein LOC108673031 [Hyalella azteca]|uniref:Uncharacterized protein LOC108673031 n=1 Tax=Hyalella azteca TaxID=294128 RepID=A0A8B7NRG1_HYAAZ|nr:uncharacterized protein LOC108673031 [Hyalella azteca]
MWVRICLALYMLASCVADVAADDQDRPETGPLFYSPYGPPSVYNRHPYPDLPLVHMIVDMPASNDDADEHDADDNQSEENQMMDIVRSMHDPIFQSTFTSSPHGNFVHGSVANAVPGHAPITFRAGSIAPTAILNKNSLQGSFRVDVVGSSQSPRLNNSFLASSKDQETRKTMPKNNSILKHKAGILLPTRYPGSRLHPVAHDSGDYIPITHFDGRINNDANRENSYTNRFLWPLRGGKNHFRSMSQFTQGIVRNKYSGLGALSNAPISENTVTSQSSKTVPSFTFNYNNAPRGRTTLTSRNEELARHIERGSLSVLGDRNLPVTRYSQKDLSHSHYEGNGPNINKYLPYIQNNHARKMTFNVQRAQSTISSAKYGGLVDQSVLAKRKIVPRGNQNHAHSAHNSKY